MHNLFLGLFRECRTGTIFEPPLRYSKDSYSKVKTFSYDFIFSNHHLKWFGPTCKEFSCVEVCDSVCVCVYTSVMYDFKVFTTVIQHFVTFQCQEEKKWQFDFVFSFHM